MKNSLLYISLSMAVGAALGTTVGMLFAPYKGTKTRRILKKQAKYLKRDLTDCVAESKEEFSKTLKEKKEAIDTSLDKAITKITEIGEKIIGKIDSKVASIDKNKNLVKE